MDQGPAHRRPGPGSGGVRDCAQHNRHRRGADLGSNRRGRQHDLVECSARVADRDHWGAVIVLRETVIFTTTLLFVASCVLNDVQTLRIPNKLTAPAMIAGLALNACYAGWGGVQTSLAGFGLATILLFGPFALG